MTETVRVGLIGTSWWADLHHLPALRSHPQADLTAICGRDRGRAEAMAQKHGAAQVFTDYREMIAKAGLDAVVVAAPDDLHHPMVMDALEARLHVVCEKPLSLTLAQSREMYEKAEAAGVRHMTNFVWRGLPHYRYVQRLIEEGFVGDCFHAHFRWWQGLGRRSEYWWRFDPERGTGVLGDIGSHMIDLARLYLGEAVEVSADLCAFIGRTGVDGRQLEPVNDSAALTLTFASGAQGLIHVSAVAHIAGRRFDQRVALHGSDGSLEIESSAAGTEIRGAKQSDKAFKPLPVPDTFWGDVDRSNPFGIFTSQSAGVRAFIDAVIEDRPAVPSFYDGLKVQEIIEAATASQTLERRIALPNP